MTAERIQAILFDGDGTLWEFEPSMRGALELCLEELWSRRPDTVGKGMTVDQMVDIREEVAAELMGRVHDLAVIRVTAFERTLERLDIADASLAAEIAASYYAHLNRLLAPRPETASVLAELAGYLLGYVSNGATLPAALGLGRFFRVALGSADRGLPKPDPAMLLDAAERLGVPPESVVMVGDSQQHDVAAARAAGMRSVLLGDQVNPDQPTPDHLIGSLVELPGVVLSLVDGA